MTTDAIPDGVPKLARRRWVDHTGERSGKLTVLGYSHFKGGHYWHCLCDCGNKTTIRMRKERNSRSCGCLTREVSSVPKLSNNQGILNRLIYVWQTGAEKRGYVWEIEDEEIRRLAHANCYYCDALPSNTYKRPKTGVTFNYSGIDRLDNRLGYISENVVSCCKRCNIAKNDMSLAEFANWIERVSGVYPFRFAPMIAILKLYDDE